MYGRSDALVWSSNPILWNKIDGRTDTGVDERSEEESHKTGFKINYQQHIINQHFAMAYIPTFSHSKEGPIEKFTQRTKFPHNCWKILKNSI